MIDNGNLLPCSDCAEPLVTVYIPTRDRPLLLNRAVRSVLSQDYKNLELILVDDCSDHRVENTWGDSRIRIIRTVEPSGACGARNAALLASNGEYVTGLDDDDCFLQGRLRAFIDYWQNKIVPMRASGARVAGLFDEVFVMAPSGGLFVGNRPHICDYKTLRRHNLVGNQVFAPLEHFLSAGLFDPSMPALQDWELWCRMSREFGSFINVRSCSYILDQRAASQRISFRPEQQIRAAFSRFVVKNDIRSPRERSDLLTHMRRWYPQVRPSVSDVSVHIAGKRPRAALAAFAQLLLIYSGRIQHTLSRSRLLLKRS